MFKQGIYAAVFGLVVLAFGFYALQLRVVIGPVILLLALIPLAGIMMARRSLRRAIPDLVFGSIDTGLLVIPALWGGILFGVPGAIAGGVIGDALTDGIAGFFEGSIAEWLRRRGVEESREALTTALGKMSGCLIGSGVVLSLALAFGFHPGLS